MNCADDNYKVGSIVYYPDYEKDTINTISREKPTDTNLWKTATILTKTDCTGSYRFRTVATDRFFVTE
jgi:hypothetical protein